MNNNGRFFRFICLILALIVSVTSFDISVLAAEDYIDAVETETVFDEENIYGSIEIEVTVSANGGIFSDSGDSILTATVGEKYGKGRDNHDLPLPSREGYLFAGWNLDPDGNAAYIDENSIVEKTEDHYIYAQWEKVLDSHKQTDGTIGGKCGTYATWKIDNNGTLTIAGSGPTTGYTTDNVPWKAYKKRVIKNLVVNVDITSIGSNMFYGCPLLTCDPSSDNGSIELKNVTDIGNGAFRGCENITSVASNAKIKEIGSEAFFGCKKLKSITTGTEFNTIGISAFENCESLEKIDLGFGLTVIPEAAFRGCKSLRVADIPKTVTTINPAAFKGCDKLQKVIIPEGVIYIADDAFNNSTTGSINTTIYATPETKGEEFVYKKADEGKLDNYFIYAKVVPNTSVPEFKFEGEPLSLLKDPKTGEELFKISNKDKYIDISYQLVSPYDKNNGLDRDGNLRYLDNDGVLELQVTIKDNGHWLGTKEKITAKVKATLPPNFTVKYEPGIGTRTGKSSASVKPFHVIPYSDRPSDPVHRYTAFNNNKSYEDTFLGWYTNPNDETTKWDMKKDTVNGNMTLFARWLTDPQYIADKMAKEEEEQRKKEEEEGKIKVGELVIEGIGKKKKIEYTGKPITFPDMKVYCGDELLVKGKDYTVAYENNTNVGKDALIRIVGKGNYEETIEIPFEITAIDLVKKKSDGKLIVDDVVYYKFTGDIVNGKPVVKMEKDGKTITLKAGRDFEYQYSGGDFVEPNDPKDIAENIRNKYIIEIVGRDNYKGTVRVEEIITESKLINNLKFNVLYDSEGNPDLEAKAKTYDEKGNTIYRKLVKGQDFTFEDDQENCVLIARGLGAFSGIKKINYGTPIKSTKIQIKTPSAKIYYTGKEVTPEIVIYDKKAPNTPLNGSLHGKEVSGVKYDYIYEYINNVKAGKATVVIKGRGKYRDMVSKTFTILPFDFNKNQNKDTRTITVDKIADQVMLKGGVTPKVVITDTTYSVSNNTVSSNSVILIEGKDYKLSYSNNKNKGSASAGAKAPTVKIKGIGNYKGNLNKTFKIDQSDVGKFDNAQIMLSDIVWKDKANICKPKITVKDFDTKNLSSGKDYRKVTSFTYADNCSIKQAGVQGEIKRAKGDAVNKLDIIPANTKINAVIKATSGGNYKGEKEVSFSIMDPALDISKAQAYVNDPQVYTGKPITLKVSDITVVMPDGTQLDNSSTTKADFVILGYEKNVNKGTATVYIRGREGKSKICYGGVKKVTFIITPKRIKQ